MVWLRDGEKNEDMFIRFDRIQERDRQTDTQTDSQTDTVWRNRPRLCIASRGKNRVRLLWIKHVLNKKVLTVIILYMCNVFL